METRVGAGQAFSFGPDHIHRLNGAEPGSVSVHAYSPPLWRMGQYAVERRRRAAPGVGLLRRRAAPAGLSQRLVVALAGGLLEPVDPCPLEQRRLHQRQRGPAATGTSRVTISSRTGGVVAGDGADR